MRLWTEVLRPRTSEVMPTTAVIPMTMPRTVREERSLLTRSVDRAMRRFSSSARRPGFFSLLFMAQRLDGIQPGRAVGGVDPEDEPHQKNDHQRQGHRPETHGGGKGR